MFTFYYCCFQVIYNFISRFHSSLSDDAVRINACGLLRGYHWNTGSLDFNRIKSWHAICLSLFLFEKSQIIYSRQCIYQSLCRNVNAFTTLWKKTSFWDFIPVLTFYSEYQDIRSPIQSFKINNDEEQE